MPIQQTRLTARDLPGSFGEPLAHQCCVSVDTTVYNKWYRGRRAEKVARMDPAWDPDRCCRAAVMEIDGQHYCRTHAGSIALERWLSGELIERTTP